MMQYKLLLDLNCESHYRRMTSPTNGLKPDTALFCENVWPLHKYLVQEINK